MTISDEESALAGAHLDTLAVRAGISRTHEGEHSEPIFATSSYIFASAEEAAARFGGDQPGNVYSRYTNPTVRTFEERIAALEGGEQAVGTASGMAAILSTCMALLKAGDHVICSRDVFGTTTNLFGKYMAKFGVEVTFVPLLDALRFVTTQRCCLWKHPQIRCARSQTWPPCPNSPSLTIACWWSITVSVRLRCRPRCRWGLISLFTLRPNILTVRVGVSVVRLLDRES
jgi:hypothetical protein